jgi:subfamily B ATP-binding cassette protein MsbA
MFKTYLRLMRFAYPLGGFLPPYIVVSLLAVLFGLVNFGLLIPLLDVLFIQETSRAIIPSQPPAFAFTSDYISETFNYYFGQVLHERGKMGALQFVCVVLIVSVFLANIFKYISVVMMEGLRVRFVRNMRNTIYKHVLNLHLGFFNNERKGDIMARITSDVSEVDFSISSTLQVILKEPLTLIAYFYLLIKISPELTLFTLLLLPISGGIIGLISRQLRKTARSVQESQGVLVSLVEEALGGLRVIKAFNAVNYQGQKFADEAQNYANLSMKLTRRRELSPPFSEFSGVLVVSIILLYGGSLVLAGDQTLKASAFIAYLAIFSQILRPAKQISQAFSNIQKGLASGDRIFQIIDIQPQYLSPKNGLEFTGLQSTIEFKDVTFRYEPEREVLSQVNITLKKGESLALVGPSGSGKSTLADLLLRFYDPENGGIFIDGRDLRSYTIESVRARIGLVSQDTVLFNDTVFANIAFCKPGATQEEVEQAAKIAFADVFIREMPLGYQTFIGDRGTRLSGGQRQRLSIARAVLLDPEILVLDEATSALDTESERLVQEALSELSKGRTSIIIAHRLSTVKDADRILVLERGHVKETGTHQSLMADENSLYKKLASMQEW